MWLFFLFGNCRSILWVWSCWIQPCFVAHYSGLPSLMWPLWALVNLGMIFVVLGFEVLICILAVSLVSAGFVGLVALHVSLLVRVPWLSQLLVYELRARARLFPGD